MAPTNERATRRAGHRIGTGRASRTTRNAHTNAGVHRNRFAPARDGARARDTHDRRVRSERAHPPANASTSRRLMSRMTSGDTRGRGCTTGYSGASKPCPQNGRRLQDRMTLDGSDDDGGSGGGGHGPAHVVHVNSHTRGRDVTSTAAAIDNPNIYYIDNYALAESSVNNTNASLSQASALFSGSQPTKLLEPPSTLPPSTFTLPVRPATTPCAIRMINELFGEDTSNDPANPTTPKRPVNPYRGNDPIKKIVQNKKLQAILADRPIPKDRKVYKEERMELRIGVSRVLK